MPEPRKRSYDATSRRARAEEERAETRRRVVEAARHLFLEKGYVATTMADIRREAGVAIQSVYNAGRSKADLLHLVNDIAVGGDDADVKVEDRPFVAEIRDEPDPGRQVELLAAAIASIQQRVAPTWIAYREAAAVDATAAEHIDGEYRRRRETIGRILQLLPEDALRRPYDESADAVSAMAGTDVYVLLTQRLGWTHQQFADWLPPTLVHLLLRDPTPTTRTKPRKATNR